MIPPANQRPSILERFISFQPCCGRCPGERIFTHRENLCAGRTVSLRDAKDLLATNGMADGLRKNGGIRELQDQTGDEAGPYSPRRILREVGERKDHERVAFCPWPCRS